MQHKIKECIETISIAKNKRLSESLIEFESLYNMAETDSDKNIIYENLKIASPRIFKFLALQMHEYPDCRKMIYNIIWRRLEKDINRLENNKNVSAMAKWIPSNNTSAHKDVNIIKNITLAKLGWPENIDKISLIESTKYVKDIISRVKYEIDILENDIRLENDIDFKKLSYIQWRKYYYSLSKYPGFQVHQFAIYENMDICNFAEIYFEKKYLEDEIDVINDVFTRKFRKSSSKSSNVYSNIPHKFIRKKIYPHIKHLSEHINITKTFFDDIVSNSVSKCDIIITDNYTYKNASRDVILIQSNKKIKYTKVGIRRYAMELLGVIFLLFLCKLFQYFQLPRILEFFQT